MAKIQDEVRKALEDAKGPEQTLSALKDVVELLAERINAVQAAVGRVEQRERKREGPQY